MRCRIEIRPAEGGDDATRFSKELAQAYTKALAAEG
jgi:protein subunit release factor A